MNKSNIERQTVHYINPYNCNRISIIDNKKDKQGDIYKIVYVVCIFFRSGPKSMFFLFLYLIKLSILV